MEQITKTEEILEKLDQGLTELFDSESYKKYLDTMAKFHKYSLNNTILIAMQKPEATLVAGYNDWKNKFHRQVQQGEKGIYIIAPAPYKKEVEKEVKNSVTGTMEIEKVEVIIPSYKATAVFDISQTKGDELPSIGINELTGEVKDWNILKEILMDLSPVAIYYEKIKNNSKGYYSLAEKQIFIKEGMEEKQECKTMIHEVAHALIHDRDSCLVEGIENNEIDSKTREVQAESIAYAVCQHLGIDTSDYSFGYIAGWSSGKEKSELKNSMEVIRKTTNHIVTEIENSLMRMKKIEEEKERKVEEQVKEVKSEIIKNKPVKK